MDFWVAGRLGAWEPACVRGWVRGWVGGWVSMVGGQVLDLADEGEHQVEEMLSSPKGAKLPSTCTLQPSFQTGSTIMEKKNENVPYLTLITPRMGRFMRTPALLMPAWHHLFHHPTY